MNDDYLADLERWSGAPLSDDYRRLLADCGGASIGEFVRLYAADELLERNRCYEVQDYCPGFLTIGDDGGGRALMIRHPLTDGSVFIVDHGSMCERDFERIADDLFAWIKASCPLGDD